MSELEQLHEALENFWLYVPETDDGTVLRLQNAQYQLMEHINRVLNDEIDYEAILQAKCDHILKFKTYTDSGDMEEYHVQYCPKCGYECVVDEEDFRADDWDDDE